MKTFIATIAAAAIVSGCAQSPDAIAPIPMGNAFAGMSCTATAGAYQQEQQLLNSLNKQQTDAVAGDAIGVLLIGVPVSSLSGSDKEGLIAASKGKITAMETRLRDCGVTIERVQYEAPIPTKYRTMSCWDMAAAAKMARDKGDDVALGYIAERSQSCPVNLRLK